MANSPQNNPFDPNPTLDAINILSYGSGTLINATDAINHAVAQITSANKNPVQKGAIYFPPRTYTLSTSCTVPAGVRLIFEYGAILSVASGKTLTIAGKVDAGHWQIFGGSGTVVLTGILEKIVPQWWGATGDGSTDDTAAINAAITAANARTSPTRGFTVFFPPGDYKVTTALTAPTKNVRLLGAGGWQRHSATGGASQSRITTTLTTGALLTVSAACIIEDLCFRGDSASTDKDNHCFLISAGGVVFHKIRIENFGGSAIKKTSGTGLWIREFMTDGCLQGRASLSDYQGVLDLDGTESIIDEAEVAGGLLANTHSAGGSGYACAIVVRSSPGKFTNVVAEFGQTGWYFSSGIGGDYINLNNCRSEFNQREGYLVNGGKVHFINCNAMNNSQDTDNTYDGWSFLAPAGQNKLIGCEVGGAGASSYKQRYGFSEAVSSLSNNLANANHYIDSYARFNIRGRIFNITSSSPLPSIAPFAWTQPLAGTGTQTFSGEAGDYWRLTVNANTATTVSANNLLPGHIYTLRIIQHSGAPTITLDTVFAKTATFTSPAASKQLTGQFVSDGTSLYQIGTWSGDM